MTPPEEIRNNGAVVDCSAAQSVAIASGSCRKWNAINCLGHPVKSVFQKEMAQP
jgi:hypothetical protein